MDDNEKIDLLEKILENAKALAKTDDQLVSARASQLVVISHAVLSLINPKRTLEKLLEYE